MLIINQKTASEMFESDDMIMKEQSDKFNNEYEDSVEDISEMSDNAESSTTDESLISDEKISANNAQDKDKKDKNKDNNKDKNTEFKPECRVNDKYSEKHSSNFNTNRNKNKDKDVKNTDTASIYNVMKQVFYIKKKTYESCYDKTSEDESDVENDR
ncbi:hypothetical protein BDBG_18111 [Blastomyces gilchristii SLH14081]|uniref:Uncharacterized protein n=1 Tax=Blastomyces gilchristii (strain SLH14081) TaxID=559298 RepID=A0A179V3H0_BLAGS|nr:uncharacterized protein BDBG_18111 [Blastomyces gilchristii SLH14081]OAT14593.1 hypothetical protein BDBG_18111 [Blastomyces gilchristii SLH14081]